MGTPTLSVYEALNGKEAGGSSSLAGHMYYVLTDSNGNTYSFGFAPAATHSPWGQGAVTPMTGLDSDLSQYAPINYSSTFGGSLRVELSASLRAPPGSRLELEKIETASQRRGLVLTVEQQKFYWYVGVAARADRRGELSEI